MKTSTSITTPSGDNHPGELFETYVVGSLPRPQWVRDVIEDRKAGKITAAQADEELDIAVPSAIRLQERAGLDHVSDGEWRRESYVKVFTEHVAGFKTDATPAVQATVSDPVVVEPIEQIDDIATDAARFLRRHTRRRTIVALPSPYILGWRMWRAGLSSDAYGTREEFILACVPIIRAEIAKLRDIGVDHIQIDEPWLLMVADPAHRKTIGAGNLDAEIALCVETVNAVLKDANSTPTSMHLCHGHFGRRRATDTGYEPIIDALGEINVDRFAMEFAAPQSHGIGVLARFPKSKTLGLGVIDHCDTTVETPEIVMDRAEAALKYVDMGRLTLNPDCGFSPGSQNPMDLDEAYGKLSALSRGARELRRRHVGAGN
jgi:5-methyltetrahydropteroyltriglutamate--homocysteine methyltransferase